MFILSRGDLNKMNQKIIPAWKMISPVLVFILAFMGLNPIKAQAQGGDKPVVAFATRSDTTTELRHRPERPPMPVVLGQIFERPRKLLPNRQNNAGVTGQDAALQTSAPAVEAATIDVNFEGVNNVNGVLPPDTNGDIGPNHYVQMVNLSFAVYDRNGTKLYGPVASNTLWQGFGGPCETTNDGDPITGGDME
jgi:hypothetical protein